MALCRRQSLSWMAAILSLGHANFNNSPSSPCIFVSNDHGLALTEWLKVAAGLPFEGKYTILHIDAHNDLNVPADSLYLNLPNDLEWISNASYRQFISASVDLASFQLAAVWVGLADRVVWIRQGHGGMVHTVSELRFNNETGSFEQSLAHDIGLDIYMKEDSPISVVDDTPNSSCGGQSSLAVCGGLRLAKSFSYHEVPESHLDTSNDATRLLEHLASQPYILDIDLDYFVDAGAKPGLSPIWDSASKSSFPFKECRESLRACRHWMDPQCVLWKELDNMLGDCSLPTASSVKHELVSCFVAFQRWCETLKEHVRHVGRGVPGGLHASEWMLLMDQLQDPTPRVHPKDFQLRLDRLTAFLSKLRFRHPAAITIARSVGAFTRIIDAIGLEERTLEMLESIFGRVILPRSPNDGATVEPNFKISLK